MKNKTNKKDVAKKVLELLQKRYPKPETHLIAANPWQLLIATILSAQCTDARVNLVTPELFKRWQNPYEMALANEEDVADCIRTTGFFRNKAKNIISASARIVNVYNGNVPNKMEDLITLAGVARKTANVVLWGAYKINEGIAVDTHVLRISYKLGLTSSKDNPVVVEKELTKLLPKKEWGNFNHRLVWFGRHVCKAKNPLCQDCEMKDFCPSFLR